MNTNLKKIHVGACLFLSFFLSGGCSIKTSDVLIAESEITTDNVPLISPWAKPKTYAVFRGTTNTYCSFLTEIGIGGTEKYKTDCGEDKLQKKIVIIGLDIPHLETKGSSYNAAAKVVLTDPITGKPFPAGTVFVLPGKEKLSAELWRAVKETLIGVAITDNEYKKISGFDFDMVFCHSNGCDQAQKAVQREIIKIKHLIHTGSPHFLNDDLNGTIHTQFSLSADLITFIGLFDALHIPYNAARTTSLSRKGKRFQDVKASPTINLKASSRTEKGGHPMINYFNSIHEWVRSFDSLLANNLTFPKNSQYKANTFVNNYGLRASFFEVFNEGAVQYDEFNIQRGLTECASGGNQNDCTNKYYVNHRLANHRFKQFRYGFRKNLNSFDSFEDAKECTLELKKLSFKKQLKVYSYKNCVNAGVAL